ncbi:MAG TPA: ThiF family adenylyltransferase [Allosphingosinicella sp.]
MVYPDNPPVKLVATYPDFFPFFRPEVRSADLKLGRHQNPIGGNLCLIGRRTSRWYAEETLADILKLQMPHLLDYARTGDAEPLAEVEEPQGEPASEYYNSDSPVGSYLLFDGRWSIPAQVQEGSFSARCRLLPHDGALPLKIQGYVAEIRSSDGKALARWEGKPLEGFPETVRGRWLRRAAPILGDINLFKEELGEQWDWLMDEARWPPRRHVALGAVLFPEEVQHQEFGDGWAVMQWVGSRRKKGLPRSITGSFVRAARAGPTDLAARMPAAATLSDTSVIFFGLGAIGAPAAIELARAGLGKLTLVDHDIVEPATVRRWAYGLTAFGEKKVSVIKERLAAEYPWTAIQIEEIRIGAAVDPGVAQRQGERMEQLIEGQHLMIDCTAEMGVNHFLSEFARVRGLPYLIANATPGAWGGIVARFEPASPCWMCFRHALYGDSGAALPPADPQGEVQPPGCAEPTFTGSSFDLTEISLELVRVAAGLLGGNDGYPRNDWDAAVLHLRDNAGRRVPPHWEPITIPRRRECTCADSR